MARRLLFALSSLDSLVILLLQLVELFLALSSDLTLATISPLNYAFVSSSVLFLPDLDCF
jgi:hypothetical protein